MDLSLAQIDLSDLDIQHINIVRIFLQAPTIVDLENKKEGWTSDGNNKLRTLTKKSKLYQGWIERSSSTGMGGLI